MTMTKPLHPPPLIEEIVLEPMACKGELVADKWWDPPQPERGSFLRRHALFLILFLAPVTLASIYFGVIAADQYVSEARFIVRSAGGGDSGNLASLMQSQKMSRAVDETYAVSEYVTSRDAADILVRDHQLRAILSRPEADVFNRFPNFYSRDNNEQLYRRFKRMVATDIDSDSGISTLEVKAFSAEDARNVAVALLHRGEALVNRLNDRANDDVLKNANQSVDEAKGKMVDAEMQLTKYRNAQNVIDPNAEATAALQALNNMTIEVAKTQASLNHLIATAPQSPMIGTMRERINSFQTEISRQRARIVGGGETMAAKLADYDKLTLDRELAGKTLAAAVAQYEQARQHANQQQLYLETIVEPNLADQPLYPKRLLSVTVVAILSLCLYWMVNAVSKSIAEHQA